MQPASSGWNWPHRSIAKDWTRQLLQCHPGRLFCKWPEAEPLQDKAAKSVALFMYKMICRYVSSWECYVTVYVSWWRYSGVKNLSSYVLLVSTKWLHMNRHSRYGCTKVIISDQGREFVDQISQKLFQMTKTEHRISSAYHPQTNSLVDRFNQAVQHSLVKLVQTNSDEKLDGSSFLFAYRTAQQKSTQVSLFELMYWVDIC